MSTKVVVEKEGKTKAATKFTILRSIMSMISPIPYKKEQMNVRDLSKDLSYQRKISLSMVKTMAEFWLPGLVGYIVVAVRKTGVCVIDGWHRIEAMRQRGIEQCDTIAYDNPGKKGEALLFVAYNRFKRTPSTLEIFNAAVVGGEPTAMSIKKCLGKHHLSVPRAPTDSGEYVQCVTALENIVIRNGGIKVLDTICDIITDAWEPTEKKRTSVHIFKGLNYLLTTKDIKGELDIESLKEKLSTVSAKGILLNGAQFLDSNMMKESGRAHCAAIMQAYNKGRTSARRKLAWK